MTTTDIKKLESKIMNRIGMKATCTDDIKTGVITNFTLETLDANTPEARVTVNYLIAYGTGFDAQLRLVNENLVVLFKEPKA